MFTIFFTLYTIITPSSTFFQDLLP